MRTLPVLGACVQGCQALRAQWVLGTGACVAKTWGHMPRGVEYGGVPWALCVDGVCCRWWVLAGPAFGWLPGAGIFPVTQMCGQPLGNTQSAFLCICFQHGLLVRSRCTSGGLLAACCTLLAAHLVAAVCPARRRREGGGTGWTPGRRHNLLFQGECLLPYQEERPGERTGRWRY